MANLKAEIANLQRKLAKTTITPANGASRGSRRVRRGRGRGGNSRGRGGNRYIAPVMRNPNPSRLAKPGGAVSAAGTIRIKRKELLTALDLDKSGYYKKAVELNVGSFPWLKNISGSFEQVQYHKLAFHYKPAVGTTASGLFMMGMDWNGKADMDDNTKAMTAVSNSTPVVEVPLWQMASMVLPANKLQTRKSYVTQNSVEVTYFDKAPGLLLVYVKGDATTQGLFIGNLWVEYEVTLSGTA